MISQWLRHCDEPLRLGERFKRISALVASGDLVIVVLINFLQNAQFLHPFGDFFASFGNFESLEFANLAGQAAGLIYDNFRPGDFALVSLPNFEVQGIMRRGYFHNAGAEFRVDRIVRDYFEFQWSQNALRLDFFSDIFLIPLVFRIHRKRGIAEFCFGPDGGKCERPIFDVIEGIFAFDVFYLQVRERGFVLGAPVHDFQIPVYQAVFVKLFERFVDGFYDIRIKCEFLARPVAGSAELAELVFHHFFIFLREFPDLFPELFAVHSEAAPTTFGVGAPTVQRVGVSPLFV